MLPVRRLPTGCCNPFPSPTPQPGDCIILNAATSSVGQCLLQLCKLLRLRAVAVVRSHGDGPFERSAAWLKGLGASEVLRDEGSLKVGGARRSDQRDRHQLPAPPQAPLPPAASPTHRGSAAASAR